MFPFPHYKVVWGRKGMASVITNLPQDGCVWSTSRPGSSKAGKDPLYSMNRGVGRPRGMFGRFGVKKNILPLPGFEIPIVQPKACSPY
jgi:hypothetical protein